MKPLLVIIIAVAGLALAAPAAGQEARQARPVQAEKAEAPPKRATVQAVASVQPTPDVGICLRGNKVSLIRNRKQADDCESLIWVSAHSWAQNQRKLIDSSASSSLSAGANARSCSSCSGTCQIVSWFSGGSSYEGADAGGGMSPSECVDAITKICESGASRYFFNAHCGN